jgi:hypothetical protein
MILLTKKSPKIPKYMCEFCQTKTSNKKDFEKHLATDKHTKKIPLTEFIIPLTEKSPNEAFFCCQKCDKNYKTRVGLWYHKQKCDINAVCNEMNHEHITKPDPNEFKQLTNLILEVVKQNNTLVIQNNENQKQNQELTKHLFEICKNGTTNNINTNNINSHNKTFNLQFFLNETCKDAMNMSEFIDSMKLQLSDLETVGKLGFVDGISNIIINNLNALDIEKRPVHCSDSKRETMYIKDQDKWEKEDDDLNRMKGIIRQVRDKNISLINTWRDLYPECLLSNSKKTDQFNKICMESFGGNQGTKKEREEKIISKIAKSVVIDKNN